MKLSVEHLGFGYDEESLLSDVNFVLEAQSRTLLLANSGAGKTTLLKCLAHLLVPKKGAVHWQSETGEQFRRPPAGKLGFVFQRDALFTELSVLENVAFPLRRQNQKKEVAEAAAEAILKRVGLGHALLLFPHSLSGGMRKRVAIARALVTKPEWVLADEPLAGLDAVTAQGIVDLFLEYPMGLLVASVENFPYWRVNQVLRLEAGQTVEPK